MTRLSESTVRMWSPPGSRRKFRTKHAAFVGWAKMLIRRRGEACACTNGYDEKGPGPYTCPWHERLFTSRAYACTSCGTPDADRSGEWCGTCQAGARCTVPTQIPDTTNYMKLRNRLARWLRWASEAAPTRAA